ncbi:hypothetical protein [Nonomuraea sp. GTA35]|uniref:hypothetical protein n=1 Tax=Nonomuraea sp. GTA35 TaxID=1676746 RepID=UPI0035BFD0AA
MQRFTEDDFGITWLMTKFHADWTNNADSAIGAVRHTLWRGLDSRYVISVRRDATLLLEGLSSESIEQLWRSGVEAANFFGHRVPSGSLWMQMLIDECDAWLQRRSITPPGSLDPIDQEAGAGHTGAILTELSEAAGAIGADLADRLTRCVHHCTPDLAFRVLLRTLVVKGEPISRGQYERFTRIGEALHYGEFVVSITEHLVAP